MLAKVIIENGQKKIQALTADTGVGAPVGSYLYLEKKSNPQGYLYCDGSTFDETAYPALYQYLGTNVLPDWRELGAKGAEKNTTLIFDSTETDPSTGQAGTQNHDVFTQGEFKDDQLQDHLHYLKTGKAPLNTEVSFSSGGQVINGGIPVEYDTDTVDVSNYNARKGTVTRGKSRAVFIYIKATSGLTENQQENVLNTINENNSYSTEEHPTGAKWIDGKPIYRKVVSIDNPPTNWSPIDLSSQFPNIDKGFLSGLCRLTRQGGIVICQSSFYHNDNGDREQLLLAENADNMRISCYLLSPFNVANIQFEVQYTKTTD